MPQKKILCIEDEVDLRSNIVEFLRMEDYEVIEAADGEEGLQCYYNAQPDLVLCDIGMPKVSGLELLELIKHDDQPDKPLCPFIFLTAYSNKEHFLTGKSLDCDDYLVKPIDFDLLLTVIQSRLRRWELIQNTANKELKRFQKYMLNVMGDHLKNPLQMMAGCADVVGGDDFYDMKQFHVDVAQLTRKQLRTIQNIMDSIAIAIDEKSYNFHGVKINSLLSEVLACSDYSEKNSDFHYVGDAFAHYEIEADYELAFALIRTLFEECCDLQRELAHLECVKQKQHLEIIIASTQRRLQQSVHWVSLEDQDVQEEIDKLMRFKSVSLLFAQCVMMQHHGEFRVDITNVYDPVYKLRFKIIEK